ncbi:MAG: TRAP transporter fused permease subunit [Litoreibacter sp.]
MGKTREEPVGSPSVVPRVDQSLANAVAFGFVLFILLHASSGPFAELFDWLARASSDGFEGLSRREKRAVLQDHWLSGGYRSFEDAFLLPTGLFLGLPILFSFVVSLLVMKTSPGMRGVNRAVAAIAFLTFGAWILKLSATDAGDLPDVGAFDFVIFPIATLIALYLTWRMYGTFIAAFCLLWVIYFFTRGLLPDWSGILAGSQSSFSQNLRQLTLGFWAQTGGMFGQPLQVAAENILIFIVFGSVMMASGAGALLMKIANRVTGGLIGGAAHAAVSSSALFGMLSGAAISNVVSTGVMTIPVIKRTGFKPAFAGAVEAAASTGGQIMPPVMGAVAFFVAGQIGLEYRFIVVAAIIPAIFYYYGAFLMIYFEARRLKIGKLPADARPALTSHERVQCLVFIVPVSVLTYFLFTQPSVPKAGFYGFVSVLVSAWILFPAFRNTEAIWKAFVQAGRMAASIIVIVTAVGLIVGLIQMSGFSGRLAQLLIQLTNGNIFVVLVVVALGSIVLGMGLPPGATYFVIVIALSSGIDAVGIPTLTLHLFVVFFAVMSTVTPPVALAAFAAAPIAGASPIETGFQAARVGLAGFIVPFVFVFHPEILYKLQTLFVLFEGKVPTNRSIPDVTQYGWDDLLSIIVAFAVSMWCIASAVTGYDRDALPTWERLLRTCVGLLALMPQMVIAVPAVLIGLGLIVFHNKSTQVLTTLKVNR